MTNITKEITHVQRAQELLALEFDGNAEKKEEAE
jgi:hypothetical protein